METVTAPRLSPAGLLCTAGLSGKFHPLELKRPRLRESIGPGVWNVRRDRPALSPLPLGAQVRERGTSTVWGLLLEGSMSGPPRPEGVFYWRGPCSESSPSTLFPLLAEGLGRWLEHLPGKQ